APNSPTVTRMDRGGLAVAIRGEAPFALVPASDEPFKVASGGGKIEVTLKLKRSKDFKDAVQVYSATPNIGPRQQGGQPPQAVGSIAAEKDEVKLSIDVPANLPAGQHTLVLRGIAGAAAPKGGNNQGQRIPMSYPTVPISVEVEGKTAPKK